MTPPRQRRLVLFAAGRSGLGQTVRALRLADHVLVGGGDVTATVVTGVPDAHRLFASQQPITVMSPLELVRLVQQPRHGASVEDLEEGVRAASSCLVELVEQLDPDIFVTTSHRGVAGELTPVLRTLRKRGCRVVLALRDIYQPPQYEQDFADLTPDEFQQVVIAGPPDVARWLPRGLMCGPVQEVVSYQGYLRPQSWTPPPGDPPRREVEVVCQVGGGRDGRALLESAMSAVSDLATSLSRSIRLRAYTGPLMPGTEVAALRASARDDTEVHAWWRSRLATDDPRGFRPDLVLCMAGYNSCVEAAATAVPTVLVPRVDPADLEQKIRAELFRGWFDHIRVVAPGSATRLRAAGADLLGRVPDHSDSVPDRPREMFARAENVAAAILGSSA